MSERSKRQKEAERMVKSLESGLLKQKPKKGRQASGKTGRSKGDKNVKSLGDGQFINQYGVVFTASEKERIRQAVNSIKRKKKRILSDTTGKYEGLKSFLTSQDGSFTGILSDKLTTSMNQYETQEALENALERLERMKVRGYETKLMGRVKENYIKTLEPTFRGKDDKFLQHLKKMSPQEFFNRRGSDITNDFLYINSNARDLDDMYIVDLVHSFGWLSKEEQLNNDVATDKYTGKHITNATIKPKKKKSTKPKKAKK